MTNLVPITNDLFDVASRLRSINDGYRVYYNTAKNRYEVHNVLQHATTYCFAVPYDSLDARTVELCQYSRIENSDKIVEEMDKNNEKLQLEQQKNAVKKVLDFADNMGVI